MHKRTCMDLCDETNNQAENNDAHVHGCYMHSTDYFRWALLYTSKAPVQLQRALCLTGSTGSPTDSLLAPLQVGTDAYQCLHVVQGLSHVPLQGCLVAPVPLPIAQKHACAGILLY